jgi:hypothetical protein
MANPAGDHGAEIIENNLNNIASARSFVKQGNRAAAEENRRRC